MSKKRKQHSASFKAKVALSGSVTLPLRGCLRLLARSGCSFRNVLMRREAFLSVCMRCSSSLIFAYQIELITDHKYLQE